MTITYEVSGYDGTAAIRSAHNRAYAEGWQQITLCSAVPNGPQAWTVTLLVYNQF